MRISKREGPNEGTASPTHMRLTERIKGHPRGEHALSSHLDKHDQSGRRNEIDEISPNPKRHHNPIEKAENKQT
jgi:hypothetical protein